MLRRALPQLLILPDQHPSYNPRARNRAQRETRTRAEANAIARLVRLRPKVGAVDVSNLRIQSLAFAQRTVYGEEACLPARQHSS